MAKRSDSLPRKSRKDSGTFCQDTESSYRRKRPLNCFDLSPERPDDRCTDRSFKKAVVAVFDEAREAMMAARCESPVAIRQTRSNSSTEKIRYDTPPRNREAQSLTSPPPLLQNQRRGFAMPDDRLPDSLYLPHP